MINNIILIILILTNVNLYAQTQSDTSDALWTIVIPKIQSYDVDMKSCNLGNSKDSLVQNFIENKGNWNYIINKIEIIGNDANAFTIISDNFLQNIEKNTNLNVEFRFQPKKVGIHNAKINIISNFDTLSQNITGIGIEKFLQINTDLIDFGDVELGNDSTITKSNLIQNISKDTIKINSFGIAGPDTEQFLILNPTANFSLPPNQSKDFTIKFNPKYLGRTSSQIYFKYDGSPNPAYANIFGKGIGGLVYIPNDSCFAGEKKNLYLRIGNIKPGGLKHIASKFKAVLRFQKSILSILNYENWQIKQDSTFLTIEGNIDSSLVLAKIEVIAGLGNFEQTTIDIIDFKLYDGNTNNQILDYDIETQSGLFKILGICNDGGKRLLNSEAITTMKIEHNSEEKFVNIKINLIEKGNSNVRIITSNGQTIDELNMKDSNEDLTLNFDISNYANGLYFVILKTPTTTITQQFVILK